MDVAEIVIYALLALWGPPLLFVAFLLWPIKKPTSDPRNETKAADPDADQVVHLHPCAALQIGRGIGKPHYMGLRVPLGSAGHFQTRKG
jgi:hypothetical protein